MTVEGIDVSRWNPEPINYKGLRFVFVQITHGIFVEPLGAIHVAAARKAGLAVMAYHFMEAGDGAAQARVCATEARKLGIDHVPMALDAEVPNIARQVGPFIKEARKTFPSVGLYSYLSWVASVGGGLMGADWGWVSYPGAFTLPAGWPRAKTLFWQYTIRGGLDRNKWLGTPAAFDKFFGVGAKPPTPIPAPAPKPIPVSPSRLALYRIITAIRATLRRLKGHHWLRLRLIAKLKRLLAQFRRKP